MTIVPTIAIFVILILGLLVVFNTMLILWFLFRVMRFALMPFIWLIAKFHFSGRWIR